MYFKEWIRCYKLLRCGNPCRMGCAMRAYRNKEHCDKCQGIGWVNQKSIWSAFRSSFHMTSFIGEFEEAIEGSEGYDPIRSGHEAYLEDHPGVTLYDFQSAAAVIRREYIKRGHDKFFSFEDEVLT